MCIARLITNSNAMSLILALLYAAPIDNIIICSKSHRKLSTQSDFRQFTEKQKPVSARAEFNDLRHSGRNGTFLSS